MEKMIIPRKKKSLKKRREQQRKTRKWIKVLVQVGFQKAEVGDMLGVTDRQVSVWLNKKDSGIAKKRLENLERLGKIALSIPDNLPTNMDKICFVWILSGQVDVRVLASLISLKAEKAA